MALFVPAFSFRHSVPAANSRVKNFERLIYQLRFCVLVTQDAFSLLPQFDRLEPAASHAILMAVVRRVSRWLQPEWVARCVEL